MRLGRATRAGVFATAKDPDAVRMRPAGCFAFGATSDDGLAVEQEAGAEREQPVLAEAVLEGHDALLEADDGAAEARGHLFDHEVAHGLLLGDDLASCRPPVAGEHVLAVSIWSHRSTLTEVARAAVHRDGEWLELVGDQVDHALLAALQDAADDHGRRLAGDAPVPGPDADAGDDVEGARSRPRCS